MSNPQAPDQVARDATDAAIMSVLDAERAARADIEAAQLESERIAESARARARALAERTERRIRRVADAFQADLASELAELDHQAQALTVPHAPVAAELAALDRAVDSVARDLAGASP